MREGTTAGPYPTLEAAKEAGAVMVNYGVFLNNMVTFLIVAFAIFLLVRGINSLKRKEAMAPSAPDSKACPQCATTIPIAAKRCPNCTSQLSAA